jgi:microcystin-dependent protein
MSFTYSIVDVKGISHNVGNAINDTSIRTTESLGRFERSNNKSNIYIYRNEIISEYVEGVQDGIYHVYPLNASNPVPIEFTDIEYSQSPVDLYPQLDRDNFDDNPPSAKTFSKRSPIGDTVTNDLKKSVTRETVDKFATTFGLANKITTVSSTSTSATITFGRGHGFAGIISGTITGGSSYIDGTYYNVRLFNNVAQTDWRGATATVIVSGGVVTSASITNPGSGYSNGNALYFDSTRIGTGNGAARLTLATAGISTNIGDVIQFTGVGTATDNYHRITNVNSATQISIAKTSGDLAIVSGQYGLLIGPSVSITSTGYNSTTGVLSITCTSPHGLLRGNKFRIIDSSNNNLGDYLVQGVTNTTQFTVLSRKSLSASNGFILKHGLSANDAISDATEENFGIRNLPFYSGETLLLNNSIASSTTTLSISTPVGISTSQRFPLGTYIQIDNEILRITSSSNNTNINVIRGVLGTRPENHDSNSLIRKIKPIAVEFRRPSVLRASGHTFEYLGYGPGNYSTALPQIQVKSLSVRESFLAQSQERSCGIVVYNGIDNNGDIFTGNTKTNASSGEVISFDIPSPTVTGQTSSALNDVFDEVTIKKKLLVEGGSSGTLLSQFDGPVTFNKEVRIKGNLTLGADSIFKISNPDIPASIAGDLLVGKDLTVAGKTRLIGELTADTGIVPNASKGAYLGSSTKPFSEAWIGEIGIATGTTLDNDRTIGTKTGNLTLSAPTGNNVAISTNASVTGDLNVTGKISAAFLDVPNVTPIGSVVMWASTSSPPTNWRICNGIQLSQATYADLYAIIGNTYNTGGETVGNFRIPDLTDRFVVGTGPAYALNATGGQATVSLQVANLPPHNHPGSSIDNDGLHNHPTSDGSHVHGQLNPDNPAQGQTGTANAPHNHPGSVGTGDAPHGHGGSVQANNAPHNHSFTNNLSGIQRGSQGPTNTVINNPTGTQSTNSANALHGHGLTIDAANAPHGHGLTIDANNAPHSHVITTTNSSHSHTVGQQGTHNHTFTIGSQGQGTAHENLPPYRSLQYIIRIQ